MILFPAWVRLRDVTISVATDIDVTQPDKQKMDICHHHTGQISKGATVDMECEAYARYVMISIPVGFLTLCEVEIYPKIRMGKENDFAY